MRVMTPLGMMMVVPHHVVYLVGQGFDKLTAAFAFGSLGAFSFTGRVVFGALSDRIGRIPTICLTYSLSIVGTLLLMSLHDPKSVHIRLVQCGSSERQWDWGLWDSRVPMSCGSI
jgi:MFS family permease